MGYRIGLIPGIIGAELKQDKWGTLEKVARLGYRGIEGSTFLQGDVSENRKRAAGLGLATVSIGSKRDVLENGLDQLIEDALTLEADHIVIFWGPCDSREQVLADTAFYDRVGAKVAAHGLKFCYHNHDHELKTVFDGVRAIDLMMDNSDPEHLYFELDVAWIQYGGEDPAS